MINNNYGTVYITLHNCCHAGKSKVYMPPNIPPSPSLTPRHVAMATKSSKPQDNTTSAQQINGNH